MSLDVSLKITDKILKNSSGIFVRENGQTVEISESEWNKRNPDMVPVRLDPEEIETNEVFDYNITHNIGKMAKEAGIYEVLWRPEEINLNKAIQLISPLSIGLETLLNKPEYFKTFNPENGWGDYDGLVKFVKEYLKACIDYPDAEISVSR